MATNEIKMGINLRQNKNSKNSGFGKYYPEVDVQETLTLKGFAKHMSDHGSIYSLDLLEGVLKKITQCLPELISQGVPIRLDPLGTFTPTCSVDKPLNSIAEMEGADPNEVVKGVHIRFLPYGVEDDNITSRRFKQEYCSLEFRNIIDTQSLTIDGKTKKVTTLKPIATAIAELKSEDNGGSSTGSDTAGGSGSDTGNGGNGSGTAFALTITKTGTGSSSVKDANNQVILSGTNVASGASVNISIDPAEGKVPTVTLNGESVSLTENDGTYMGSFLMPAQASTLVIDSGTDDNGGGNGDDY